MFFFNVNVKKITNESHSGKITNKLKINANENLSNVYIFTIKLLIVYFLTFHGRNEIILFNHFNVNNFSVKNLILFLMVNYFVFFLIKAVKQYNLIKSADYYFAISNVLLYTPFLFIVNTTFTFLFVLETISILILYKLVSSKV